MSEWVPSWEGSSLVYEAVFGKVRFSFSLPSLPYMANCDVPKCVFCVCKRGAMLPTVDAVQPQIVRVFLFTR